MNTLNTVPAEKQTAKRGSMLITAIIFTSVLSIGLASMLSYANHINSTARRDTLRELALHLAESGVEIGINDLQQGRVSTNFWKRENLEYEIGSYRAELDMAVVQNGSDNSIYDIYTVVTIPFKTGNLSRAVTVRVQATDSATEPDDGDPFYGTFPYAIIAREEININHGNGDKRPMFASYSSDFTSNPVFGIHTGHSASIVTPNSQNNAINANNAIIHGVLNSGGGEIGYDSRFKNPNQVDQNLWLSMSEDDSPTGINTEGIQNSFNGTVNDPVYPETASYLSPDGQSEVTDQAFWGANDNQITYGVDQNYWQNGQNADASDLYSANGNQRTIGKSGEQTVLTTPSINLQNGATLTVKGDVVLYVKRNFNIHGNIEFENGATLHLIASENNHFTGSTNNEKPIQFRVTPYVDVNADNPSGPNVQFNNTDRIAMVINAPYSRVSTGGQGNTNFDYMGAVIADTFSSPNGVRFFYDVTLGEAGAPADDDDIFDDNSDRTYELILWNEKQVSQVIAYLVSWGVDV